MCGVWHPWIRCQLLAQGNRVSWINLACCYQLIQHLNLVLDFELADQAGRESVRDKGFHVRSPMRSGSLGATGSDQRNDKGQCGGHDGPPKPSGSSKDQRETSSLRALWSLGLGLRSDCGAASTRCARCRVHGNVDVNATALAGALTPSRGTRNPPFLRALIVSGTVGRVRSSKSVSATGLGPSCRVRGATVMAPGALRPRGDPALRTVLRPGHTPQLGPTAPAPDLRGRGRTTNPGRPGCSARDHHGGLRSDYRVTESERFARWKHSAGWPNKARSVSLPCGPVAAVSARPPPHTRPRTPPPHAPPPYAAGTRGLQVDPFPPRRQPPVSGA